MQGYHTNTEDTGSFGYNSVCYITSINRISAGILIVLMILIVLVLVLILFIVLIILIVLSASVSADDIYSAGIFFVLFTKFLRRLSVHVSSNPFWSHSFSSIHNIVSFSIWTRFQRQNFFISPFSFKIWPCPPPHPSIWGSLSSIPAPAPNIPHCVAYDEGRRNGDLVPAAVTRQRTFDSSSTACSSRIPPRGRSSRLCRL